jgi:hypothetical protein
MKLYRGHIAAAKSFPLGTPMGVSDVQSQILRGRTQKRRRHDIQNTRIRSIGIATHVLRFGKNGLGERGGSGIEGIETGEDGATHSSVGGFGEDRAVG